RRVIGTAAAPDHHGRADRCRPPPQHTPGPGREAGRILPDRVFLRVTRRSRTRRRALPPSTAPALPLPAWGGGVGGRGRFRVSLPTMCFVAPQRPSPPPSPRKHGERERSAFGVRGRLRESCVCGKNPSPPPSPRKNGEREPSAFG